LLAVRRALGRTSRHLAPSIDGDPRRIITRSDVCLRVGQSRRPRPRGRSTRPSPAARRRITRRPNGPGIHAPQRTLAPVAFATLGPHLAWSLGDRRRPALRLPPTNDLP
jgi:hypothetical protein